MSIRTDFAALRSLRAGEVRALVSAMFLVPLFGVALRVRGVTRVLRAVGEVRPHSGEHPALQSQEIARLVGAVASRAPFRANCLVRSLVLKFLLARHGIASRLRVGVNKQGHEFEAHAWIELGGHPLNDAADVQQRFTPFEGDIAARLFRV